MNAPVPVGIYFVLRNNTTIYKGVIRGADQMHALCLAVKAALAYISAMHSGHIYIWTCPKALAVTASLRQQLD
jgi:hypothetical protein